MRELAVRGHGKEVWANECGGTLQVWANEESRNRMIDLIMQSHFQVVTLRRPGKAGRKAYPPPTCLVVLP